MQSYLRKKGRAMQAFFQMRRRVQTLERKELDDIVGIWVDAALRLAPRDLRLMGHIVSRQDRLGGTNVSKDGHVDHR